MENDVLLRQASPSRLGNDMNDMNDTIITIFDNFVSNSTIITIKGLT